MKNENLLNKDLFIKNRQNLYKMVKDNSLIILFSADTYPRSGNQPFKFRQNSDLFYFSGLDQEKTILLLYKDSKNKTIREYAFIVEPNENMLIWTGHKLLKDEAKNISGIEKIEYLKSFADIYNNLVTKVDSIYYSFSSNIRSGKVGNTNLTDWKNTFETKYPNKLYLDLDLYSHVLRLQKSSAEVGTMRQACNITGEAFLSASRFLKPGVYENQVEAEITRVFLSMGARDFAYLPILASGKNNCVLHYSTNREMCKGGDLLLMDFGSEFNYYSSDLSRTIPISGKYTARQKEVYNSVLNVHKEIKKKFVVGSSLPKLNEECGKLIEEELLKLGLLKQNDIKNQNPENPAYKRYYMHGVSHYMGLDVHDVGDRTIELLPGMVMSCEPGIYIAEEGFGIRLENDILITESTPVDLCENIPIEAEEIEDLMNSGK